MRIALYGGSFDPIHTGHTMIARYVADSGIADAVWLMVSPQNPWKQESDMASEADRLAMARLATASIGNVEVSDFEMHLPRPSYTIDTLHALREAYPQHSFRLIIGADNWRDFSGWRNAEEILSDYGVIVYPRPGVSMTSSPGASLPSPEEGRTVILPSTAPLSDVSSTLIRERLKAGLTPPPGALHPDVAAYIAAHRLYS